MTLGLQNHAHCYRQEPDSRSKMIGVNLTPTEASALKVLADKEARSLSSMARIILLNALQTAET